MARTAPMRCGRSAGAMYFLEPGHGSERHDATTTFTGSWWISAGMAESVKKLLELLLCILHPIAVVLIWIDLVGRSDMGLVAKLTWGIAAIVPIVPFVYVLTGNDFI